VGVLPALLNDPKIRVRTVAEKKNDVPSIRQFSYRPTRRRMVGAVDIHLLITGGSPVASIVLLVIAIGNLVPRASLKEAPITNARCNIVGQRGPRLRIPISSDL
jgi:hypothetical protein